MYTLAKALICMHLIPSREKTFSGYLFIMLTFTTLIFKIVRCEDLAWAVLDLHCSSFVINSSSWQWAHVVNPDGLTAADGLLTSYKCVIPLSFLDCVVKHPCEQLARVYISHFGKWDLSSQWWKVFPFRTKVASGILVLGSYLGTK